MAVEGRDHLLHYGSGLWEGQFLDATENLESGVCLYRLAIAARDSRTQALRGSERGLFRRFRETRVYASAPSKYYKRTVVVTDIGLREFRSFCTDVFSFVVKIVLIMRLIISASAVSKRAALYPGFLLVRVRYRIEQLRSLHEDFSNQTSSQFPESLINSKPSHRCKGRCRMTRTSSNSLLWTFLNFLLAQY